MAIRPVTGADGKLYYRDPANYYDSTNSGADATFLSKEGQEQIKGYQDQWKAAQAAGDQAGMDAAHAAAEALREKAGYQGGANGGAYNELWRGQAWDQGTEGYQGYTSKYQGQIDALTQKLLGQGGERFTYGEAPTYSSRYQDQIDALGQQILGREAFSYDPEQDPTYQQYKTSYTRNGQRAMQDTLGQVSARTGGLASSYAGSAAQQTYDGYMSALADKIPELKQLAYQMYLDEWNGKRNDLSMLQGMEASDYDRYLTQLGQYNTDRSFDYGVHRDQVGDQLSGLDALLGLEQTDYNRYRDQVGDLRYNDETAYDRGIYADETAYNRGLYADETTYKRNLQKAEQLAAAGDFSGYKALGYSDEEVQRLQAAFLLQHPEMAALLQTGGGAGSYMGVDSMGNLIYPGGGASSGVVGGPDGKSDGGSGTSGKSSGGGNSSGNSNSSSRSGSGSGTGGTSSSGSTESENKTANYGGDVLALGIGPISYSAAQDLVRQGKVQVYTDSSGKLKYRWANGYNKNNYKGMRGTGLLGR